MKKGDLKTNDEVAAFDIYESISKFERTFGTIKTRALIMALISVISTNEKKVSRRRK